MQKMTIYLREEVAGQIKRVARSEGRSEAEIIREALDDYFERRRRDVPVILGTSTGGTIGAAESEDWLRENWHPE
ncbi:MAG TPA: CopG family transcriptional regulator [Thermomicrobiales bacterium]|nr:CopG family transcriptional regulator [Thermomicrobiales bacterium]